MSRAPRNRTLDCDEHEQALLSRELLTLAAPSSLAEIENRVLCQDSLAAVGFLPAASIDLLILDPPYNLSKNYHGNVFREQEADDYAQWFESLLEKLSPLLKHDASVYVCTDWRTSIIVAPILQKHFKLRNRITWEREKGRGAKSNWKNNTEDIWFCTCSDDYTFHVDAVKLKRKVIAPYRHKDGSPKDWNEGAGGNFRLTHPSNIWTDISIPFWSMPENTDHPTQKPEKLMAKLLLASRNNNDVIMDPFLGSGISAVVAKKLGRRFIGIEQNPQYCCWALKRLRQVDDDASIQGYADGVFWERNSLAAQVKQQSGNKKKTSHEKKRG